MNEWNSKDVISISSSARGLIPIGVSLDDADRAVVAATLEYTGGNILRASTILDLSYAGLRLKLMRWQAADKELEC